MGVAYSQTLTAAGGTAPYTFAITTGTLPAGLTMSTAGVISGTPTATASPATSLTIRATDNFGCQGTRVITLQICPVITLSTLNSTLTVSTAYSSSAAASGGASPYTYAVTSGVLPNGLTLNTGTGAVTGTPTSTASQTFTITATDANGCTGARASTLTPSCPVMTLNPATMPFGTVGVAYSQTLTTTGGITPYVYSVSSGTLPAG